MNWWGRGAGLLLLLIVVLFSCEEDVSTIGIKRPNSKFRVNYAEINIPSSVITFDKLVTSNKATDGDGVQRLLVGQYQDDVFGTVRAEIYTQISPPVDAVAIGATALLDSAVLQLNTDFYYYGTKTPSEQIFEVHELLDSIKQESYYSTSKIPYAPEVLAQKSITIDPGEFDESLTANSDNITTNNKTKNFRVILQGTFINNLFESVRSETDLLTDFPEFTQKHKGLAIVPVNSDKILGVDAKISATTLSTGTKLTLYYTESGSQKQINFTLYPYSLNPTVAFSSIDFDRSGTPLAGATTPFKDFYPADNKRYVQSGTAVLTKLDLTPYFSYMDTVKNAILNSAEFVIENEASDFTPPAELQFRVLSDENKYASFLVDTIVDGNVYQINRLNELRAMYPSSVNPNDDGTFDLLNDAIDLLTLSPNTTNTMSGFATTFFQDQYIQQYNEKRIKYCAVLPRETQFRKSVNRIVLKDNIKLKIYYTTPIVETKE